MICDNYKFRMQKEFQHQRKIPYDLPPIRTFVTPEELCTLCKYIVDEISLPPAIKWTIIDVLKWIENLGFKQYRNTFYENMVNGRKLLLLDVNALLHMNIKDMEHIQKIRGAIEELFGVEKELFARSISLQDKEPETTYKYYKTSTGPKYELVKRSELWKYFLRPKRPALNHFEKLHEWLQHHEEIQTERVGGIHRYNLYGVKKGKAIEPKPEPLPCICMPPCECTWREPFYRKPWILKYLLKKGYSSAPADEPDRTGCKCPAICECRWTEKDTRTPWTLKLLLRKEKIIIMEDKQINKQSNHLKPVLRKKRFGIIIHGKNNASNTNDSANITKVIFRKVPCECAPSSVCLCKCNKVNVPVDDNFKAGEATK